MLISSQSFAIELGVYGRHQSFHIKIGGYQPHSSLEASSTLQFAGRGIALEELWADAWSGWHQLLSTFSSNLRLEGIGSTNKQSAT
jgi:hypothetical protein